jgi:hypothetical protein
MLDPRRLLFNNGSHSEHEHAPDPAASKS